MYVVYLYIPFVLTHRVYVKMINFITLKNYIVLLTLHLWFEFEFKSWLLLFLNYEFRHI